jgi:hypothetical protein
MPSKNQDHRCKAKKKNGECCGAAAGEGGLCFFHANPNKAAELGRIGGKSKHDRVGTTDRLPALDNVSGVREMVTLLIADVLSGKLRPNVASGLAPLLNLQLRAINLTDVEQRLTKLEKRIDEIKDGNGDQTLPMSASGVTKA